MYRNTVEATLFVRKFTDNFSLSLSKSSAQR